MAIKKKDFAKAGMKEMDLCAESYDLNLIQALKWIKKMFAGKLV